MKLWIRYLYALMISGENVSNLNMSASWDEYMDYVALVVVKRSKFEIGLPLQSCINAMGRDKEAEQKIIDYCKHTYYK